MTVFDDFGEGVQKSWDEFKGMYDKPLFLIISVLLGLWILFLLGMLFFSKSPWISLFLLFLLFLTAVGIVVYMAWHGKDIPDLTPPAQPASGQLPTGPSIVGPSTAQPAAGQLPTGPSIAGPPTAGPPTTGPPTAGIPIASPPTNGTFQDSILAKHNELRATRNARPLVWDADLANRAIGWAKVLANKCGTLSHPTDKGDACKYMNRCIPNTGGDGQNLALQSVAGRDLPSPQQSGMSGVQDWYDEYKIYDPCKPRAPDVGHYTQLVWKGAKKIGCGYSECNANKTRIVACNYDTGNITNNQSVIDAYNANVEPTC